MGASVLCSATVCVCWMANISVVDYEISCLW
jgi:hypothetical protein